jgi:hypothetical protein
MNQKLLCRYGRELDPFITPMFIPSISNARNSSASNPTTITVGQTDAVVD